jgi:hypothetical protein
MEEGLQENVEQETVKLFRLNFHELRQKRLTSP